MAPRSTDLNGVLFETDAETEDLALTKTPVQEAIDKEWHKSYNWHIIVFVLMLYSAGLYGGYLLLFSAKWQTGLFAWLLLMAGFLGVTAGSHRLWSHKSYNAKWPLQLILMIFHTLALQLSVKTWVHGHRMHHKYSDTDADPHNITRGLFFSHIGWLMMEKHPDFERKSKGLDLSDIETNTVLRFQEKYNVILVPLICFIFPTVVPVYIWNESWINVIYVMVCLRLTVSFNILGLINSAAHSLGYKPYDKNISSTDFNLLSFFALGEGFHNYHHTFPWDYKTGEFGVLNFTTAFIDFCKKIGWAYDLKTVSEDIIQKRAVRTGDGSHHIWGWGDKDQPKEEVNAAVRINSKIE